MNQAHGHGNKVGTGSHKTDAEMGVVIQKVPCGAAPYGPDISRDGKSVWTAYIDGELVGVGSTAGQARRKGYAVIRARRDGQKS